MSIIMKNKFKRRIGKFVIWLEMLLACFLVVTVLIGFSDLVSYLKIIIELSPQEAYNYFQDFLSHLLLLVIGLEMIIMLVRHTPNSVLEVLIFAIARKMLIASDHMYDLTLGIIALAGVFAIKRYLCPGSVCSTIVDHKDNFDEQDSFNF